MVKFEYKKAVPEIDIAGTVYRLPVKTAVMVDKINDIQKKIAAAKSAVEQSEATVDGVALFIGKEAAAKLFPSPAEADTDELAALWFALNAESNRATNELVRKYAPVRKA